MAEKDKGKAPFKVDSSKKDEFRRRLIANNITSGNPNNGPTARGSDQDKKKK